MKLFVYGTLKRGYHNHYIIEGSKLLGEAVLPDYGIFSLGSFPGIVRRYDYRTHGELYEIDEALLPRLDRLEGVPHLYTRETETVVANGEDVHTDVSVYVYANPHGFSRPLIESGRWPAV